MKSQILTNSEHKLICDFLEDVLYGRATKISPALRRLYKQIKKNILVLRNNYGVIETLLDYEDKFLTNTESPSNSGQEESP